jgi:PAS domain S-box-containing protein
MPIDDPVKILVVDDLSDKLLVYRTVLEEPGVEIVCAQSGAEALMHLLHDEFAVVLLDVNMPIMDGFETAGLIRSRKRCAHTPIIFVTAHTDELHALRGYSYGAVDYMLSPIVPQILRTKVRVFLELFRLNRQVRRQAAKQLDQARHEHDRLAAVLENAADFVAQADVHGRITHVNRAGLSMLGYSDRTSKPRDVHTIQPNWASDLTANEGIPAAMSEGIWIGESALVHANGREIPVSQVIISHKNAAGEVDSLSFISRDISERKSSERAIAESERRYRQLVHSMPAAVYVCDAGGRVILHNEAARSLWGRTPEIGKELWCGSYRTYHADSRPIADAELPMVVALRDRRPVRGLELIIERPDGSRSHVLPHIEPLFNEKNELIGAVNMLVDITDRKRAESARSLLAAIVESTDDAVISETLDGTINSCNPGAERLYGYSQEELVAQPVASLIPTDRADEEARILEKIRSGERVQHFETIRLGKGGRRIDVSLSVSPIRDLDGKIIGASKIARDITERKRAELELKRHREHLEQLVRERTAELEASMQHLRLADRLASIGTLAAGLGHDMGNLLLPIRMRLDVLEQAELPEDAKADIQAIGSACEYLKQLAHGLRLFALNPDDTKASSELTDIPSLWKEIVPFLRNALPRDVELSSEFAENLPTVTMSQHALTQVMYNLVKNAGDALSGRSGGRVRVTTASAPAGGAVLLCVIDNGPGMTDEVRRRCLEPFFTTKTRGISTGLGLALVTGALRRVDGQLEIDSDSSGTTFRLSLPTREGRDQSRSDSSNASVPSARVVINDARIRSYAVSLLKSAGLRIVDSALDASTPDVIVINDQYRDSSDIQDFLNARPNARAIILAEPDGQATDRRLLFVGARPTSAALREAIRSLDIRELELARTGAAL